MSLAATIGLEEIRAARERTAGFVLRTPLVRLAADAPAEVWLKLECLQPTGSFKIRGASSALTAAPRETLAEGVWTVSAGNMAQGVAWQAKRLGIPCGVVVPDDAPATKLDALARLGARVEKVSLARWFEVFATGRHPGMSGLFVHPVNDPAVIAGNGTIGLEILEDLPDVDAILVPWGGGGLSCGIASAVRGLGSRALVYACEVETGAPFAASFAAGAPRTVPFTPSFVDGIGAPFILEEIWPLAHGLLAGAVVVSVAEVAAAIRLLVERNRVIAEGAGAASVAAALTGKLEARRVVCVVSGGNLDTGKLATILMGGIP